MVQTAPKTRQRPPRFAYKLINPVLKTLLRSPLHSRISNRLMILSFKGRKSGKWYSTPVGYTQVGDTLLVATESPWWKNLRHAASVRVQLRGQERMGTANVVTDDAEIMASFRAILENAPQFGEFIGVRREANGAPNAEDVANVRQRGFVVVKIRLTA